MKKAFLIATMMILAVFVGSSLASGGGPSILVTITGMKEVPKMVNGKEAAGLVPADDTKTGDVILYTVTYKNDGDRDALGVLLHDPVPKGTAYIDKSAGGKDATVLFSIDGGKTYSESPIRKILDKSGAEKAVAAGPDEFTDIQWKIGKPVKSKEEGHVWFKVMVK